MDMTGKKVLVTGAAGGLGTSICWAFARAGAQVLALDIDPAKGERLVAAGEGEGAEVRARLRFVPGDLADLGALAAQLAALFEAQGGIDVLINNAAIYPSRSIEEFSIEAVSYTHLTLPTKA